MKDSYWWQHHHPFLEKNENEQGKILENCLKDIRKSKETKRNYPVTIKIYSKLLQVIEQKSVLIIKKSYKTFSFISFSQLITYIIYV